DNTLRVGDLRAEDFDAIVVAGGQAPMFTFDKADGLQRIFLDFFRAGKPAAALCHGTALLLHLKGENEEAFVKGKRMTGFANSEEDYADHAVGSKVMPFRIEDEARRLGAEFVAKPAFEPHAVRDGNLVTGQQQNSGGETARLVLEMLGGHAR
ncbi:MAG: type 1 glutamine amidotransferase domain-containing protein, partial [Bryobacterales bacterium]